MQQRQLRLGDVLDDYCPRERRLTNHVVVAMVGADVKQTRCTTCEAEHEYKQARLPRLRRKTEAPALAPGLPRRHEPTPVNPASPAVEEPTPEVSDVAATTPSAPAAEETTAPPEGDADESSRDDEGPVHRPLIRASLPRAEGTPPPTRPAPDFTIRQPAGGRHNRFRPRHGGHQPQGNRSGGYTGGGNQMRGMPRHGGGQPQSNRAPNRQGGQGRKRSR
jgi:hypothetical protein